MGRILKVYSLNYLFRKVALAIQGMDSTCITLVTAKPVRGCRVIQTRNKMDSRYWISSGHWEAAMVNKGKREQWCKCWGWTASNDEYQQGNIAKIGADKRPLDFMSRKSLYYLEILGRSQDRTKISGSHLKGKGRRDGNDYRLFLNCDTLKVRCDSSIDHLLIMDSQGPGEGAHLGDGGCFSGLWFIHKIIPCSHCFGLAFLLPVLYSSLQGKTNQSVLFHSHTRCQFVFVHIFSSWHSLHFVFTMLRWWHTDRVTTIWLSLILHSPRKNSRTVTEVVFPFD